MYNLAVHWPIDLHTNRYKAQNIRVPVIAYTDNTTFIARTRAEIEKILKITTEFYNLNDIEINSKKSELLVAGTRSKELKFIEYGTKNKEKIIEKKRNESTRFLGI